MLDKDLETHYSVKCRMSLGDSYHVCGYARDEENLKELMEHLKKTWRYVEYTAYKAKAYVEPPSKRKVKK
ncbi:hypothetical protein CL97_gp080 [Cronobacter phage CR9]|uniref:Uncharacterized protein n=1 Tax=Cronobacter phage CR9 TaxID=1162290 RepID=M1F279_9CAUD|nr:hypothetical protein CL97_gp080 [Cronobacter phage CR9]AFH20964.1 hypothetical protein CR9_080 [Cronobacter phage CR9]